MARKARNRKRDERGEYVLLRVPNPYVPNSLGTIHCVGTKAELNKARRGLALGGVTKLAILKVVSVETYRPSVAKVGGASFVEAKKAAAKPKRS